MVPLVWSPRNYELFEYNKMIVTYGFTILITSVWLFQMIQQKKLIFKRTILDIPIFLFLTSQILSTIFSIDTHTSIWGYYSRSNGGLLSIISYILLYYGLVSNVAQTQISNLLKFGLASGLIISFWGVLEHFGASPSCLILGRGFNDSCWIQDVQSRVFATLGQPNWMAAFLEMLIFPAFYFLLTEQGLLKKSIYYLSLILIYAAFTFTYSQGATLGLAAGAVIVGLFLLASKLQQEDQLIDSRWILWVVVGLIAVNLLFGSVFTKRTLGEYFTKSSPIANTQKAPAPGTTQLESGGTDSGKIRLIVWQGAWDIFKHYPVLGSGVETFAYSYYSFRPTAHNLVSEWDFLYNKAHNEYLNYLSTTGAVGFLTYMAVILVFLIWSVRYLLVAIKFRQPNPTIPLFVACILGAYVSYLVQNFFGFSVVIVAIFFFLFPGLSFVMTKRVDNLSISKKLKFAKTLSNFIYKRPLYPQTLTGILLFVTIYLFFSLFRIWYADTNFAQGERAMDLGNAGQSYNYLLAAVDLNPAEPFYHSELGSAAASAAVALQDTDATLSAELKNEAVSETETSLKTSPANVSYWRTAIRTYYELASIDKTYAGKTLTAMGQAIKLAPTDPKLYYNKAIILGQLDKNDEAIQALEKAIQLKPNYKEAYLALSLFLFDKGETEKAVQATKAVFKFIPNDQDALKQLQDWGKKGISTESAGSV